MRKLGYEPPDPNPEIKPSERNPYKGYVYVLYCEGFTKIGLTTKPIQSRIKDIQAGNPFQIHLLGVIESDHIQDLESQLHEKFARFHVRNEWFKIPSWMLQELSLKFSKNGPTYEDRPARLRRLYADLPINGVHADS